jgi:HK97 family phage prohead protease
MATSYFNMAHPASGDDVAFKAISGQIGIDKAEGIVECFVSGVGNKDSVGDIVVPGAFNASLKRRKPRVVWGHDWNQPIGKVLEIYEVPKTDSRLPEKMRRAGIGGLFAKVQFNLNTERGREAFANVAFYGMDQEWSIGYKTLVADYDPARQANMLKEVELYEVSPVLHGANQLTGTISVKDDSSALSSSVEEKRWQWVDDNESEKEDGDKMSTLGQAIGVALGKPVDILDVSDDSVVFRTEDNMTWRATVSVEDGNYVIGKPVKVRKVPMYVEDEKPQAGGGDKPQDNPNQEEDVNTPPPDMAIKEDAEEPEGIRDEDPSMGALGTPDIALAWSKTLGCTGYHSHGGGYMPCSTHEEYVSSMKKYNDNANINLSNNYLAGVEVEEAKDAECSCSTEKGHGYKPRRDDDDDKRGLDDPMATLLMTYNNLIPMMGAGKIRSELLKMVQKLEEFMTTVREKPTVTPDMLGKELSGFVVQVKTDDDKTDIISSVLEDAPVYAVKADGGVDVHFSTDMARDEIMEKVAYALADLDFDFDIETRDDIDGEIL